MNKSWSSSSEGFCEVFFVGGFATLTLLVNATTCGILLEYLGLTKPPEAALKGWKTRAARLSWPSWTPFGKSCRS